MLSDSSLASLLLVMVGIPGCYLNWLTVIGVLDSKTPFEMICSIHAIGDLLIVILMTFWCAPVIFSNATTFGEGIANTICGSIICYAWYLTHFTQFTQAINRFMAIHSYMYYKSVFSTYNTKRILLVLCTFLLVYFFVPYIDGCHFVFYLATWQWSFQPTQCGLIFGLYLDFYFTIALLLLISALDLCTAVGIYHHMKNLRSNSRHFSRTELLFFIQSCLSNFVFIVDLALFFVGPVIYKSMFGRAPDKFGSFMINTLFMQISHSLDGLIMALFNRRTRSRILSPRGVCKRRVGETSFLRSSNSKLPVIATIDRAGDSSRHFPKPESETKH
ncbi:hypothetical protein Q1695_016172 [Nippostrongylus brasiliensis]|nr:hypothetical protein Q1695_016172 [Nippostrongylus brasiliensis]